MGIFNNLFKKNNTKTQVISTGQKTIVNNTLNLSKDDFSLIVQDITYNPNRGTIIKGKVLSGNITPNEKVLINGISYLVDDIEISNSEIKVAKANDIVSLLISDIYKNQVSIGTLVIKKK